MTGLIKTIADLPALNKIPNQGKWSDSNSLISLFQVGIAAAGLVAAGFIVVSAITIATSQGDLSKTKKGVRGVIYASIGLAIVIAAEAISFFIAGSVK